MREVTEVLKSGDPVPDHPASNNVYPITKILAVLDADDHTKLTPGLHSNEVSCLISGHHSLHHLYRYAICHRDGCDRIFHTRKKVFMIVEVDANPITPTLRDTAEASSRP